MIAARSAELSGKEGVPPSPIAQFRREPRVRQQAPRAAFLLCVDHDAARQKAERTFNRAHVLVGDEMRDAFLGQKALDQRDEHEIVGANEFDQMRSLSASGRALAAAPSALYGRDDLM